MFFLLSCRTASCLTFFNFPHETADISLMHHPVVFCLSLGWRPAAVDFSPYFEKYFGIGYSDEKLPGRFF